VRVAHQSLVVHRDLKPANILVDEAGEPRLLDFGVAKLLRPDPAGHTDGTAAARPLMTPKYASPEQVRGERVTTASDTYSLGVLLYQLLTGHPPYRLDSRSSEEAARVICEQEPQRPSTAVRGTEEIAGSDGTVVRLTPEAVSRTREDEPRRLRRRLAGDLDSIVLKALRKEPQHRYGSVEQFSADVGRHLDGLPVIARTGTAAYRAGKFVRRNRWALAVAAVFMLLIGGFTFTLLHGLQRTTEERDRARRLSSVLETLLETIQPSTPKPETAEMKAALDEVAGIFDETLRDYLLEQAVLLDGLGRAYRSYGYYEEAGPLLDKALEIRRQELGDRHLLVAESLHNLAFLHQEQGDQQTAEELLRRSLEIKYEHWTRDDPKLAPSLNNLAMVLRSRGVPGEAEGLFRRVLAIRREQYGDGAPELVRTLNNLGAVLVDRGAYEEAVEIYRRGLEIRRSFYGPGHVEVSLSRNSLANALFNLNEFEEAARLFREDLGSRLKIYDPDHPKVARARNNLAMVLHAQGHLEEAEDEFRAALEIQLSKLGKNHREVVVTKRNLAALLAAKGQPAAGERLAREALAIFRKTQVDGTWLIAYAESVLGACLTGLGRFPEAEGLLVGNYDPIRRVRGERSPYTRYVRDRIVELYEAWGKPELARQYFQDDSAPER
ncbi:MAG: tetratricopeptide repeat protein, partial [bacterium]|nr:tetratricopeptide repeat protein [bacterium]